jgi:hypothetical protein
MERLAEDRRRSAMEHVRAALADNHWIFSQGMNRSAADRMAVSILENTEKEMNRLHGPPGA